MNELLPTLACATILLALGLTTACEEKRNDVVGRSDWNPSTQGIIGTPQPQGTYRPVWHLDTRLVPNREEMARILAVAKEFNARTYVFLAICSHTGLRLCEVMHIKSSDVADNKLCVTRRKKRVLQESIIEVPNSLWPLLKEWSDSYDDYLFPGNAKPCVIRRSKKGVKLADEYACQGGHTSLRVIQRDWAIIVAEAGLRKRGRGIHQTRHYFGTQFYNATRDIRATQEALAHSNMEMTARYAHVVDMKEKVNKVQGLL